MKKLDREPEPGELWAYVTSDVNGRSELIPVFILKRAPRAKTSKIVYFTCVVYEHELPMIHDLFWPDLRWRFVS